MQVGGKKERRPVSWEQYLADLEAEGCATAAQGDATSLKRFCQRAGVIQISYMQPAVKDGKETIVEARSHGAVTAARLRTIDGIPEILPRLVEIHEICYQAGERGGTNLGLIERNFADWSEEDMMRAFLVNLADQEGSLHANGQPDLGDVLLLIESWEAFRKFRMLEQKLGEKQGLTAHFVTQELDRIRKSTEAFRAETVDAAYARIVRAATPASYDTAKVASALEGFPELSADDVTAIVASPADAGKLVGKKMGKRMGELKSALAACQL